MKKGELITIFVLSFIASLAAIAVAALYAKNRVQASVASNPTALAIGSVLSNL